MAQRLVLAGVSLLLALGLAWGLNRLRGEPEDRAVAAVIADDIHALLRDRALTSGSPLEAPPWARGLAREPVPESVARLLWPQIAASAKASVYDRHCYLRSAGGLDIEVPWRGHPDGKWRLRTNSLGLRNDVEPAAERPQLRVLLTGDSHVEGVGNNDEGLAYALERRLSSDRTAEVLNAAKAGYSLYNHLGVLERFLELGLAPDVFVIVFYGGNDFVDALPLHHYFGRTVPPSDAATLAADVERFERFPSGAYWQAYRQLQYFARWPEEKRPAFDACVAVTGALAGLCDERGIQLVIVYLPAFLDAQPGRYDAPRAQIRAATGLTVEDECLGSRLAEHWIEAVRDLGIDVLDLRRPIAESRDTLYWPKDHHLNPAGHRLVAELLYARLGA